MSKDNITPTSAELEILNLLWEEQPRTVKEIHKALLKKRDIGYTTALKLMQNMHVKGLLERELEGKSHLYSAVYKKEETRGNLLHSFVDTAFAGSSSSLVMQLLGNKKTSKEELNEIKKLIEQLENDQS